MKNRYFWYVGKPVASWIFEDEVKNLSASYKLYWHKPFSAAHHHVLYHDKGVNQIFNDGLLIAICFIYAISLSQFSSLLGVSGSLLMSHLNIYILCCGSISVYTTEDNLTWFLSASLLEKVLFLFLYLSNYNYLVFYYVLSSGHSVIY